MAQKIIGLSHDFIIHPGETLSEVLDNKSMTQKELAIRTGVSEKHVSKVINGKQDITPSFSKKLEFALGIDSSFWTNLQANYDNELAEFEELNNINEEELEIVKQTNKIVEYFKSTFHFECEKDDVSKVIALRKWLNLSSLTIIPKVALGAAFRAETKTEMNIYVTYTWVKLCEKALEAFTTPNKLDKEKLESYLPEIKKLMLIDDINYAINQLTQLLSDCGIVFKVVKHFRGAPIQGFIKKRNDERLLLCLTIRRKYADIFWFSLFHEIGHILNGDAETSLVDYFFSNDAEEKMADNFARDILINENEFKKFVDSEGYNQYSNIEKFAKTQSVLPCIVIGRLQKEGIISYTKYSDKKIKYDWC